MFVEMFGVGKIYKESIYNFTYMSGSQNLLYESLKSVIDYIKFDDNPEVKNINKAVKDVVNALVKEQYQGEDQGEDQGQKAYNQPTKDLEVRFVKQYPEVNLSSTLKDKQDAKDPIILVKIDKQHNQNGNNKNILFVCVVYKIENSTTSEKTTTKSYKLFPIAVKVANSLIPFDYSYNTGETGEKKYTGEIKTKVAEGAKEKGEGEAEGAKEKGEGEAEGAKATVQKLLTIEVTNNEFTIISTDESFTGGAGKNKTRYYKKAKKASQPTRKRGRPRKNKPILPFL